MKLHPASVHPRDANCTLHQIYANMSFGIELLVTGRRSTRVGKVYLWSRHSDLSAIVWSVGVAPPLALQQLCNFSQNLKLFRVTSWFEFKRATFQVGSLDGSLRKSVMTK